LNLGLVLRLKEKYSLAIENYMKALELYEFKEDKAMVYNNIAYVYIGQRNLIKAKEFTLKAIELSNEEKIANRRFKYFNTLLEIMVNEKVGYAYFDDIYSRLICELEKCVLVFGEHEEVKIFLNKVSYLIFKYHDIKKADELVYIIKHIIEKCERNPKIEMELCSIVIEMYDKVLRGEAIVDDKKTISANFNYSN